MTRSKVLPFIIAAAVAMIVITNFSIMRLLAQAASTGVHLFYSVWPLLLTSTAAILLVMSTLYHALEGVLKELEEGEANARREGLRDPLTKLGNRHLLSDRLVHAAGDLRRSGRRFALLMVDLDRFKEVNDAYGHSVGDQLLTQVARRLTEIVRETDILIRFGGDEFMVLQHDVQSESAVRRLSQRITNTLRRPFKVDIYELNIGASVGAVVADAGEGDPTEYIRRADIALYEAKRRGRNRVEFYSADLDKKLQRRSELKRELIDAISRQAVDVHYQPQVDSDGRVTAAEALIRWSSKTFGPVPASELVSIAEDAGLSESLALLVFRKACAAARQWPALRVAVNFSPSQLLSAHLPEKLRRICKQEEVPCGQIELEVTESLFLEDGIGCEAIFEQLRKFGFRIALDDFSAGYSSLLYLRRFQVDTVKLDKGFSEGCDSHQNIALIRAAVMLAHALKLQVVAEGIETAEQEQIAVQGGCDGFQGFFYAPAMQAEELSTFLKNRLAIAA